VTLLNSGKPVVFRLPVIGGYTGRGGKKRGAVKWQPLIRWQRKESEYR